MTIRNNTIGLVPLEPEHIDLLYRWENDPEVWRVSHTRVPLSKHALASYIKNSHRDIWESREQRLLIEKNADNKVIGSIELFDFDPYHSRSGVGIIIFEDEDREKGIATQALNLLIDYAKNELGIQQLYANIAQNNLPSIALFKKLGFEQCALKKKWLRIPGGWENELMFQLFL